MSSASFHRLKKGAQNPRVALGHATRKMRPLLGGTELAVSSRVPFGTNVLNEDWDLLIILDTCRVDAIRQLQASLTEEWLTKCDIDQRISIGGSTLEWTAQTFCEKNRKLVSDIDYVAGNMVVEDVLSGNQEPEDSLGAPWSPTAWDPLSPQDFNQFVSAWKHRDAKPPNEGHLGGPHATSQIVTDMAINHGRETAPDRLIVHYLQPHYPYYEAATAADQDELRRWQRFPFNHLRSGLISFERVWNTYMAELKSVANSVGTLLENYDADQAIVTADHGEAFGEWGGYKHRGGTVHPKVRRVPWIETVATDMKSYQPTLETREGDANRKETLRALGYL